MDPRKEREREFHNRIFSDETREKSAKFYAVSETSRAFYRAAIEARAPGHDVLEYGCGTGSMAFNLTRLGGRVTGIDISDGAIGQARETARSEGIEARFEVMDAENLDFPADSFDLVCGTGIIHHLELHNAFAQIVRVLRPGGVAVFAEPLGHNPLINWYRDRTPDQRTPDEHPLVVSDFALARRYFGAVGVHPFHLLSLFTVPFRNSGAFPTLLRASDAADRALFRVIPYMARHAWTAVLVMEGPRKEAAATTGAGS